MPGLAEVDWEALKRKLPYERTRKGLEKRNRLFEKFDPNGNGSLTLAEVRDGVRDVLELDQFCDATPAIQCAFIAANRFRGESQPAGAAGSGIDLVEKKEFRLLLQCLFSCFELWVMFDQVDSKGDGKMSFDEFDKALPNLEPWGVTVETSAAQTTFSQIDGSSDGKVAFCEFCTWALQTKLKNAGYESTENDEQVLKELVVQDRILVDLKQYDKEQDGYITTDDLKTVMSKLDESVMTEGTVDAIMKAGDATKDGKVNYKDFLGWLFTGGKMKKKVTEAVVKAALKERGITEERILDGLMVAFDQDSTGDLDSDEFNTLIKNVDRVLATQDDDDGTPPDCKAFIRLAKTENGAYEQKGNPKLKMLLTSAGLMPTSSKDLKDTYQKLKAKCPGKGVMFMIDARMVKLQFHLQNADPEKHNQQASVAYRRTPDEPGGKPVYDDNGKLVMKTQEDLMNMGREGYAGVPYNLRKRGHYANGHLDVFAGPMGEHPIYVSYLWYTGEVIDGQPQYKIMMGRGEYEDGLFTAFHRSGDEFTEDDYNTPCEYSSDGDHFFCETSANEFKDVMNSVQVVYGTGGIPFIPILHFQPYFIDNGDALKSHPNPYGKVLMDNIREGKLLYVGMSAGSMAWGWSLGPLTSDPDQFMLHDTDGGDVDHVDLGQDSELGKVWLFPGLGKYVGIPYELSVKVHVHFDPSTCSYGGTAHKAEKLSKVISAIANKDHYCALLADYDWYAGQGDALEVVDGRLFYHVGYSEGIDDVAADVLPKLQELGMKGDKMPRQPPGNSPDGFRFEWTPNRGEVIAAGPKSTRPFHMYASSNGLCSDAHPAYPLGADVNDDFIQEALKKRGITEPRILQSLPMAFDHDDSGCLSAQELDAMLNHVDRIMEQEDDPDDEPPDCKAFIRLADTKNGPYQDPGNKDLKMLLTSAGIMPDSTPDVKDTLTKLKSQVSGSGVLYLVDARLCNLQFPHLNADPEKHNDRTKVSYRREPDAPGGKPVYDGDKLVMKSQEELLNMGYAGVPYTLLKKGHYANGHLDQLAGREGEVPVYVAFLWYTGEVVNGEPKYSICLGKGAYRNGTFVAFNTRDGGEFTEEDWNTSCLYSNEGDHFFKEVAGGEFESAIGSVQVVYATGGIPYLPIMHFQPYFVDGGKHLKDKPNPYGMAILENLKKGDLVYVGMSAGSMAWGWTLGPLTSDPDNFMLMDAEDKDGDNISAVDFGQDSELGKFWLFPGLGKYVGIPHDLTLKVHVHFDASQASYGGTAHKAEKAAKIISGIAGKDKYCALLSDYDWDKGQGDVLEVSGGKFSYHVGYSDASQDVAPDALERLKKSGCTETKLPLMPPNNSPQGWSFKWDPTKGEVIAAGPKAKKPFHCYASSTGPIDGFHPAYPQGVELSDEYAIQQLKARGLTEPRVLEGLTLAFDADDSGKLSQVEYDKMMTHVDRILDEEDDEEDVVADAKCFFRLADTKNGAYDTPGNPKLKMILSSAGIMPESTPDLKQTLEKLKADTPGKGVLYLCDARMCTMQFHLLNGDPAKHNQQHSVAYHRRPDKPGGKPVRDSAGKLEMKSQEELRKMGYAGVPYTLLKEGHYANGHLDQLAGREGEVPVFVAYLWYSGEIVNGEPQYQIFLAKGKYVNGSFTAFNTSGAEFTENDYNTPPLCSDEGDHFFAKVSGDEFKEVISTIQVVYATGGIPYLPIMHFQPYFVDGGKVMKDKPNPYGLNILDNLKDGNIVYIGMSAGSMAWGWSLGPLTSDPDKFMLFDADAKVGSDGTAESVDFGQNSELGKKWLFPGLGKYVGIPYDITLKVHVTFHPNNMAYGGTAHKAEKAAKVISGVAAKDHYSALLADYDWDKGQGDALEVSGGKLFYHVGFSDKVDPVPARFKEQLKSLGYEADTMPRIPAGNPAEGWSFEWAPNDGEFIAAGPKATKKPFHLYASSEGPCADAHPAFSG